MPKDLFIKPNDGRLVRDPLDREPLAAEGEAKPCSSYWRRRLDDGDVVECKPSKTKEQ